MIAEKTRAYLALTRLDRPVGIFLLLWPTYWALWVAGEGRPDLFIFLIFTLGVIAMRSAGCAINDFADRHVDGHVTRTKGRPLATGRITSREALAVFAALVGVSFLLVLQLNATTIALSVVAVILAATYPFGKRFHHLPQVHLGLAFGWAIPMAFAAHHGEVAPVAWLLLLANIGWTLAYDTLYAMADRPDDLKIGVKSSAILFGRFDLAAVALAYLWTLAWLVGVGWMAGLAVGYFVGLAIAAVSAVWILRTARSRQLADCVLAFRRNNVFGAIVMLALIAGFL
ncbi:4-hydroxybenzoate octaprenyltransferase [Guyparkeria halophila]|uniref:4-hydroxybenzoate octaprenyltransferase n=1 Tax=Guyparkeria halophila TaxID=47960 RepID=A0ABZ0YZD6_9GAMM|nr:4-hydroxybenzoate octaprenyltransferase [Guyparkeria halophila]WQH17408.1 4-hydroxybenzoate octaprenyltransferase [Guyparkeria halophila]